MGECILVCLLSSTLVNISSFITIIHLYVNSRCFDIRVHHIDVLLILISVSEPTASTQTLSLSSILHVLKGCHLSSTQPVIFQQLNKTSAAPFKLLREREISFHGLFSLKHVIWVCHFSCIQSSSMSSPLVHTLLDWIISFQHVNIIKVCKVCSLLPTHYSLQQKGQGHLLAC